MTIRFLCPCCFHAELTRPEGRCVTKVLAIVSSSLVQVARAAKQCGLTVIAEKWNAEHPARWSLYDGRLAKQQVASKVLGQLEKMVRSYIRDELDVISQGS
ncbi:MAG: hypothetical protein LBU24_03020 [Methanocalculaceae archaeon]|jgi:signal recognition particle subunit SEC65|nr:hypothetical protein [Methanocalculaceae archaeon]